MNKIARFFEEHVEKMVLVVVGLICAWLLITRVIFSPNMVKVGDRKLSPSAIDKYVYKEAQSLQQSGGGAPVPMPPYEPRLPEFVKLLDSAIQGISVDPDAVAPPKSDAGTFAAGVYRLPGIGEVTDVAVNLIRAVAYVPIDEVTPENMYDKAGNEPNDIDLVSVEAKFDVEKLYDSFKAAFSDNVEEIYADPCHAKPIFAKVQLQRQQLTEDGRWSDWREVPRAKIDHNRGLFNIGEKVEDLPSGGLDVLKIQFAYKQTQIDLLQPQPYQFASAREEWFPPSLHDEFEDFQRKERQEELRKEREEAKEAREQANERRASGRRSGTEIGGYGTGVGGQGRRGGATDMYGGGGTLGGTNTRNRSRSRDSATGGRTGTGLPGETGTRTRGRGRGSSRRTQSQTGDYADMTYGGIEGLAGTPGTQRGPRRPTVNDVYLKYDEIALTRLTDFSKIREPLVFWAHDDTVEPESIYRYRIRLGVFNPVAGTNQLDERDKSKADQAILWSGFSDTTEPVEIMGRLYFFANNVHEANKTVTVQVSRLTLGHWYSQDFPVRQGELIGESVEYEPPEPDRRSTLRAGGLRDPGAAVLGSLGPGVSRAVGPGVSPGARLSTFGGSSNTSNIPEYIDYATGAVMVDAVRVSDWSTGRPMRERLYYDMLYSYDGINILHMPVDRTNWPKDLVTTFGVIAKLEREPQEPFKSFGQGGSRRTGDLGGYGDEMMYEDGYYDDMGGMY